jgi:hypothetical protein
MMVESWKYSAAANPTTPIEILESLVQFPECRFHLASNTSSTAKLLDLLSEPDAFDSDDEPNSGFSRVLSNPNTTQKSMLKILSHHPELERNLAFNPNCPSEIMKRLELSKDDFVLSCLRENPASSRNFLANSVKEIMGLQTWETVTDYYTMGKNPSLLVSEMEQLTQHPVSQVREYVAQNRSATPKVLKLLVNDENNWVRRSVSGNPNSTLEILELLAHDTSRLKPSWGLDYSNNDARFVYHGVMNHPNCSQELKNFIETLEWKARNLR